MAEDKNESVTIDNTEDLTKVAETAEVVKETKTVPIVKVEDTEVAAQTETVIVFRATRPLMDYEYAELEKRIRQENEKSGLKIVLAPFSVDVEIKQV